MTLAAATTARDALALAAAAGLLFLSGGGRAADPAPQPQASTAPEPRGSSAWSGAQASPTEAAEAPDHLRASAGTDDLETGRRILSRHCGSCHTPGLPTTKPGALAIFSLADADWTAHMTPKQICVSGRRINGTSHEPGEVRAYQELVARLLAQRGASPCGS